MKNFLRFFLVISIGLVFFAPRSYAASEAACAIWICLPGGFEPSECGPAHSEFKRRIKKGQSPLPELSSCTTGPNGESVSGRYQLGYERWVPCEEGYVLREGRQAGSYRANKAACYLETCAPAEFSEDANRYCQSYAAIERPKPNYVKMWVSGEYLGQFFY